MIWLQLFFSFLQIGLFSFGGGYAAMPLIQEQIVNIHGWLDMDQFTDLITISQMTPGPIVTLLAKLYLKYQKLDVLQSVLDSLRPAVVALIAAAGISILITAFWGSEGVIRPVNTNWILVVIFVVCVVFLKKLKWNPIMVMVLAGVMKLAAAAAQKWIF